MKSLVVFYSRTGNTKTVAEDINKLLKNDVEEIFTPKKRKGPIALLICGKEASQKKLTKIKDTKKDPSKYDLILIGTPIWAWNMSSPVRTYISQNKGKFKKVAFFCTMGGSGDEQCFKDMHNLCGKKPIATLGIITKELSDKDYNNKIKKFVNKIKNG